MTTKHRWVRSPLFWDGRWMVAEFRTRVDKYGYNLRYFIVHGDNEEYNPQGFAFYWSDYIPSPNSSERSS